MFNAFEEGDRPVQGAAASRHFILSGESTRRVGCSTDVTCRVGPGRRQGGFRQFHRAPDPLRVSSRCASGEEPSCGLSDGRAIERHGIVRHGQVLPVRRGCGNCHQRVFATPVLQVMLARLIVGDQAPAAYCFVQCLAYAVPGVGGELRSHQGPEPLGRRA